MKVLVYADTEREARLFYKAKEGQTVGYRSIKDYGNGEKADEIVFAKEYDLEPKEEKPKKKKKDD